MVGIEHEVRPPGVDETIAEGESPGDYVERMARLKAAAVGAPDDPDIVLAADTTVVIDGAILGKPEDVEDAVRMLGLLSGATHAVYTSVAARRGAHTESAWDRVRVTFRSLGEDEIRTYVRTGEPLDKAGAYGIQGFGATIVERIEGDFFAVMGLSLVRTLEVLARVGVSYEFGPLRIAKQGSAPGRRGAVHGAEP
jgi:septum formation protein